MLICIGRKDNQKHKRGNICSMAFAPNYVWHCFGHLRHNAVGTWLGYHGVSAKRPWCLEKETLQACCTPCFPAFSREKGTKKMPHLRHPYFFTQKQILFYSILFTDTFSKFSRISIRCRVEFLPFSFTSTDTS